MSHCSFLYTSNTNEPVTSYDTYLNDTGKEIDEIMMCGARIPFLWLAMFSAGNAYANDGVDEDDIENEYLVFITTIEMAIKNLLKRYDSLKLLIPKNYSSHLDNLIKRLEISNNKYIHVAIDDVVQVGASSMLEEAEGLESTLMELDVEIPKKITGIRKIIKDYHVPSCWDHLLGMSGMSTGLIFTKLTVINEENQCFISGEVTADKILEWDI